MDAMITGSNRGIGLEFARQMVNRGERVFAATRNPQTATPLMELAAKSDGRLMILDLDVSLKKSIEEAVEEVSCHTDRLDLLINNAGINLGSQGLGDSTLGSDLGSLDSDFMTTFFQVNSLAPVIMAQAFLPLLERADPGKIVHLSSMLGSLEVAPVEGGNYAYDASKAALNMLNRRLARDLASRGIISVAMHPGWVKTDMGGPEAPMKAEQSVRMMLKVIDKLKSEQSGGFLQFNGKTHPW